MHYRLSDHHGPFLLMTYLIQDSSDISLFDKFLFRRIHLRTSFWLDQQKKAKSLSFRKAGKTIFTFLCISFVFLDMWMTSCWENILARWVSSRQGPQRACPTKIKKNTISEKTIRHILRVFCHVAFECEDDVPTEASSCHPWTLYSMNVIGWCHLRTSPDRFR